MTKLTGLLPKLAVFLVAAIVGGSIAYVAAAAINRPQLVPTAGEAPDYTLTTADTGTIAAFDLIDAPQTAVTLPPLSDGDLGAAADALLDDAPPPGTTPLGFPRVPFVSQFDGGPFANANCTLASGAMLARLAFGVVTTGSVLRTLQFDQDGGTDLHDLNTAVYRGYGSQLHLGGLLPQQMMALSLKGYGIVIQGNTSVLNKDVKVAGFNGPHAVYIDGAFAGDADTPPAFYVMDPQGKGNYDGGWWPASEVAKFGRAFSGTDRIAAAWAFPPGGVPPVVIDPDVPDLPGGEPESSPGPAAASPTPLPSDAGLPEGVEPGDEPEPEPPVLGDPPILTPVEVADVDLVPFLTVCVVTPPPKGCPEGKEAVFDKPPPILHIDLGPDIEVVAVDSSEPNVAFVAFRVEGSAPADVTFWESDGTPPTIHSAAAMASLLIGGQPTTVARLDVLAGTEYHFQVSAGNGIFTTSSAVGTFKTGDGVKTFDVALASKADPTFKLTTGLSPFLHLAPDALAPPLVASDDLPANKCGAAVDFGGVDYCEPLDAATDIGCTQAMVTYELLGIEASGVVVQAFPIETGTSDGLPSLIGIIEADGPAGSGEVAVGCLASGLTYTIALDAVGDAVGILASTQVSVP